jgi:outer membrane protein OmpA-like peptidoglycan-associated protein
MKGLGRFGIALVMALAAGFAAAQESGALSLNLAAVTYPERWVDISFTNTAAAPTGAVLKGRARGDKGGRTQIQLDWKGMQPAVLFGGDVAAYGLFAITPEGTIDNLGELAVRGASGSGEWTTGRKRFALVVAADISATLPRPSEMVVFFSNPAPPSEAPTTSFTSTDFRKAPRSDMASVAGKTWTDKTPIELVQAERAMAAAKQYGAAEGNAAAMAEAERTLAQARNLAAGSGSAKTIADFSRRTISSVTTAAIDTTRMRAEKAAAEAEAKRKAEADALAAQAKMAEAQAKTATQQASASAAAAQAASQQAAAMEARARDLEAQQQVLVAEQAQLENERQALIVDRDRIRAERDELADMLTTSLATVAAVRDSARGRIVDLPGILFDTGKSTLKPEAQVSIAKLSGILMMFPFSTLEIRGHTDNTGSAEMNMQLSKDRAKSVYDFFVKQGMDPAKLSADGSGMNEPIADNSTAEGRAQNRRVEVLIIEGGALE